MFRKIKVVIQASFVLLKHFVLCYVLGEENDWICRLITFLLILPLTTNIAVSC